MQLPLSSESYIASDSTLQLTARATDELQNTVWKAEDGGDLSTEVFALWSSGSTRLPILMFDLFVSLNTHSVTQLPQSVSLPLLPQRCKKDFLYPESTHTAYPGPES